jgi:hypothetical protein
MTWPDTFHIQHLKEEVMSEETKSFQEVANEIAKESFEKYMAEDEANRSKTRREALREASPEERLKEFEFNERVGGLALLVGVRPHAVKHVCRDAREVFELKDGEITPRNGATDPNDPLRLLEPSRWLEELKKTDSYLFSDDKDTTAH